MDGIDVPFWLARPLRAIGRVCTFSIKRIVTLFCFTVFGLLLFITTRIFIIKVMERVMSE